MADEKNNIPNRGNAFKGFSSRSERTNFKLYDFELIKQDLMNRLSVRKGERVENPAFGTIIYDALFEPLTEATRQLIIDDVTEQLNADPRLATNEIIVEEYEHGIAIQASLTYVPYNITEKLVFKFDRENSLRLS
jgi:phage baseplate assembly protein W|tara:strand:- start:4492 stop:4896 length:405 start_codon:yes stop_codon:yes gene_type:complete